MHKSCLKKSTTIYNEIYISINMTIVTTEQYSEFVKIYDILNFSTLKNCAYKY